MKIISFEEYRTVDSPANKDIRIADVKKCNNGKCDEQKKDKDPLPQKSSSCNSGCPKKSAEKPCMYTKYPHLVELQARPIKLCPNIKCYCTKCVDERVIPVGVIFLVYIG